MDLALLFGALIIVTGPTVIAPLLRNVRPTEKISSILRWEGIIIDPIGASIAVLVFDFIAARGGAFESPFFGFFRILGVGTILGLAGGYLLTFLVRRFLVPDYLRDVSVLTSVLAIFAISKMPLPPNLACWPLPSWASIWRTAICASCVRSGILKSGSVCY
ncbi:MAG: cation:proton antiporter [Caldilineaceae bacterium]